MKKIVSTLVFIVLLAFSIALPATSFGLLSGIKASDYSPISVPISYPISLPTKVPTVILIPTATPTKMPTPTPTNVPTPIVKPVVYTFTAIPVMSYADLRTLTFSRNSTANPVKVTLSVPAKVMVPGVTGCATLKGCTFEYTMKGSETKFSKTVYLKNPGVYTFTVKFTDINTGKVTTLYRSLMRYSWMRFK